MSRAPTTASSPQRDGSAWLDGSLVALQAAIQLQANTCFRSIVSRCRLHYHWRRRGGHAMRRCYQAGAVPTEGPEPGGRPLLLHCGARPRRVPALTGPGACSRSNHGAGRSGGLRAIAQLRPRCCVHSHSICAASCAAVECAGDSACCAQISPADDNAWSAGVWTGLRRSLSAPPAVAWQASGSAISGTPWCPGEPNNKGGLEGCATLVTICSASGAALVNDYPCGLPMSVLCALDAAPECSTTAATPNQTPGLNGGSTACVQQVGGCQAKPYARHCRPRAVLVSVLLITCVLHAPGATH